MNHAGHQVHFLERLERVDGEEQALALKLYYDADFVRAYLEGAQIPPEYERVALALSDQPDGPHAVVTREGTFVTCLGAGMEPRGLYVLERARTVGLHEYLERMRKACDEVVRAGLDPKQVFRTARSASYRLSREQFEELRLVSAVFSDEMYPSMGKASLRVARGFSRFALGLGSKARRIRRLSPALEKRLRSYWEEVFFMSHLAVVHAANAADLEWVFHENCRAEELVDMTLCFLYCDLLYGMSARALWSAAAFADMVAPRLMAALRSDVVAKKDYYAMVMAVIALRRPDYARPFKEVLRGWKAAWEGFGAEELTTNQCVEKTLSALILPVLESPERAHKEHVRRAHEHYAAAYRVGDAQGREVAPEALDDAQALSLYHLVLFDRQGGEETLIHLADALPFIAQASAADLYPPEVIMADQPSWVPELGLAWLEHLGHRLSMRAPTRVEATPGRNDRCPCESGRKYKQCCARAEAMS